MKKLIIMSLFTLSSMLCFAGNGQKEVALENFNVVTVENTQTTELQEFFNHQSNYDLIAEIFVCGPGGTGTSFFITITPAMGTGCVDATQLATMIALYESIAAISYPDACDIQITANKRSDCVH